MFVIDDPDNPYEDPRQLRRHISKGLVRAFEQLAKLGDPIAVAREIDGWCWLCFGRGEVAESEGAPYGACPDCGGSGKRAG